MARTVRRGPEFSHLKSSMPMVSKAHIRAVHQWPTLLNGNDSSSPCRILSQRSKDEDDGVESPRGGFEVDENMDLVGEDLDDSIPKHPLDENPRFASAHIYSALKARMEAIAGGAGKRYRVRTMKGFLNVHRTPDDPFRTDNIVDQLEEGQIVESVGPGVSNTCSQTGLPVEWVEHDGNGGGWSVAEFSGFQWLEPIDD